MCDILFGFFFFEQKAAYWLRISDWCSDVSSSDLSMEFSCTRSFGTVGLSRVSIGPPIRVIERGVFGSFMSDISATAASTGTEGRSEERRVGKECVSE